MKMMLIAENSCTGLEIPDKKTREFQNTITYFTGVFLGHTNRLDYLVVMLVIVW